MTLTNLSYFSLLAIIFCITTTFFEPRLLRPPHNRRHPSEVCVYHFKAQSLLIPLCPATLIRSSGACFHITGEHGVRAYSDCLAHGFTQGASTKSDTLLQLHSCRFLVVQERFPFAL